MSKQSAWELHSQLLVGGLLKNNRKLYEKVRFAEQVSGEDLYPNGSYRAIFAILDDCYANKLALTPEVVWKESGREIPLDWLTELSRQDLDESTVISSSRLILDLAARHDKLAAIHEAAREMMDEKKSHIDTSKRLIERLTSRSNVRALPSRGWDILERAKQRADEGEVRHLTNTGIQWLDNMLRGGLREQRFLAIAGNEKSRKTTWVRNIILGALRENTNTDPDLPPQFEPRESVDVLFLGLENSQQITTFDFVAMLMYEYLHFYRDPNDEFIPGVTFGEMCNGEDAEDAYVSNAWVNWPDDLKAAMLYALAQMKKMNLYILDSGAETGNLKSFDDMMNSLRRHMHTVADPRVHTIIVVDYAQLAKKFYRIYEDMSLFSNEMLRVANDYKTTVIALSQNNRTYKKERANDVDANVLGTAGGGDLENAVHAYMEVQYDSDENENLLKIFMRRMRRGKSSRKSYQDYIIHPPSGYIISNQNQRRRDDIAF